MIRMRIVKDVQVAPADTHMLDGDEHFVINGLGDRDPYKGEVAFAGPELTQRAHG
jgi:hypothetical protein